MSHASESLFRILTVAALRAGVLAFAMMAVLSFAPASAQVFQDGSTIIVIDPNDPDQGFSTGPVILQDLADQDEAILAIRLPGAKCGQVRTAGKDEEWRNCKWNWRGECVCR